MVETPTGCEMSPRLSEQGGTLGRMQLPFYLGEIEDPERVSRGPNSSQLVRAKLRSEPKSFFSLIYLFIYL